MIDPASYAPTELRWLLYAVPRVTTPAQWRLQPIIFSDGRGFLVDSTDEAFAWREWIDVADRYVIGVGTLAELTALRTACANRVSIHEAALAEARKKVADIEEAMQKELEGWVSEARVSQPALVAIDGGRKTK